MKHNFLSTFFSKIFKEILLFPESTAEEDGRRQAGDGHIAVEQHAPILHLLRQVYAQFLFGGRR